MNTSFSFIIPFLKGELRGIFKIIIILLCFPFFSSQAFALKIKNFKNTNRSYTQQSDGSSEQDYQIAKEQQVKEILNKYLEQCKLIYVDRSPRVVFDALLQEINNKFAKSFTYRDLLSEDVHIYYATYDWPAKYLEDFHKNCKGSMFLAMEQAIKMHIK